MLIPLYGVPQPSLRFWPVVQRNLLVWKKLAVPSVMGNIAEPLITLIAFGYGLGSLIGAIDGEPYIRYLASGSIAVSCALAATFEALYSAFSRMHVQRTWDAILNAPLTLDDVVAAELVWAASKSVLSGLAIMIVVWALGLATSPLSLAALAVVPLIGLTFGALGLAVTAMSPSYDFFMYYFTLFITPIAMLSGVFFPLGELPPAFQTVAWLLPLSHAVALVRPLMLGDVPADVALHLAVLAAYAVAGFYVALVLFRRRLLS